MLSTVKRKDFWNTQKKPSVFGSEKDLRFLALSNWFEAWWVSIARHGVLSALEVKNTAITAAVFKAALKVNVKKYGTDMHRLIFSIFHQWILNWTYLQVVRIVHIYLYHFIIDFSNIARFSSWQLYSAWSETPCDAVTWRYQLVSRSGTPERVEKKKHSHYASK